jgi:hypothetical protein
MAVDRETWFVHEAPGYAPAMTDPTFIPEGGRELLAVYPDEQRAEQARAALLDAGVPATEIHLDRDADTVTSLRAEMHEEMSNSWIVPNAAAVYPKESAQSMAIVGLVGAGLGLLAAFPLALIDFGSTYWVRFAIWAAVLVTMGLTIALVAGPASGAKRPAEKPAGARGVVLRVDRDTAELRRLLGGLGPIRIDEVSVGDQPIDTVSSAGSGTLPDEAAERTKDIAANAKGDDYHEQR